MSNKSTLKHITVYGQPDRAFERALKVQTATRLVKTALRASGKVIAAKYNEACTIQDLKRFDDKHKTHLYDEYKQRQHDAAVDAMRTQVFGTDRERNLAGQFI